LHPNGNVYQLTPAGLGKLETLRKKYEQLMGSPLCHELSVENKGHQ
jgi:hypothetical protein